jgi:hypothetical protein
VLSSLTTVSPRRCSSPVHLRYIPEAETTTSKLSVNPRVEWAISRVPSRLESPDSWSARSQSAMDVLTPSSASLASKVGVPDCIQRTCISAVVSTLVLNLCNLSSNPESD